MAPTRNPPDLFKFLEEVFSCGPSKKQEAIERIPKTQQKRIKTVLQVVALEHRNERRGDRPGTFKTIDEALALEDYREMNNPPKRESRPAPNFNGEEAPQSSIIFQALKVSEDVIKFVNEKIQGNQTPSSSPQPSGNVESFLSSIFCCSPRKK